MIERFEEQEASRDPPGLRLTSKGRANLLAEIVTYETTDTVGWSACVVEATMLIHVYRLLSFCIRRASFGFCREMTAVLRHRQADASNKGALKLVALWTREFASLLPAALQGAGARAATNGHIQAS